MKRLLYLSFFVTSLSILFPYLSAQDAQTPEREPTVHYGTLVEIRARATDRSNDVSTWRSVWTHADNPWFSTLDGHMELLVGPAASPQTKSGPQLMCITKHEAPQDTSVVRFGDAIVLRSMAATSSRTQNKIVNLGCGRKWWTYARGHAWYSNNASIMVGPNDDPTGMIHQGKPRAEQGLETFIIESVTGKKKGDPVYQTDVVRLKTAGKFPKGEFAAHRFMWVHMPHKKWGPTYGALCIGGTGGGPDIAGMQAGQGDRSLSQLNEFNIRHAKRTQANAQTFDHANECTPLYLPSGTLVALLAHPSNLPPAYFRADGKKLVVDAKSAAKPDTHFTLRMQRQGWLGISSKTADNNFLLGYHNPLNISFANKQFEAPTDTKQHWYLDNTLDKSILRNKASHQFISMDTSGKIGFSLDRSAALEVTVQLLSRPPQKFSPRLVVESADYGTSGRTITITNKLQEMVDKQGGSQIYIAPGTYSSYFSDPAPGATKNVKVTFNIDGQKETHTLTEYQSLNVVTTPYTKTEAESMDKYQLELRRMAQRQANVELVRNKMVALQTPDGKYLKFVNGRLMATGTDLLDPAVILNGVVSEDRVAFQSDFGGKTFLYSESGSPSDPQAFKAIFAGKQPAPPSLWYLEGNADEAYLKNSQSGGYLSRVVGGEMLTGQLGQIAKHGDWAKLKVIQLSEFQKNLAIARSKPTMAERISAMMDLVNLITNDDEKTPFIKEVEVMVNQRSEQDVPGLTNLLNATEFNNNFLKRQGKPYPYGGYVSYIREVRSFMLVGQTRNLAITYKQGKVAWLSDKKFQFTTPGQGMVSARIKATDSVYFCFHREPTTRTVDEASYAIKIGSNNNTRTDILRNGKIVYSFFSSQDKVTDPPQSVTIGGKEGPPLYEIKPQAMLIPSTTDAAPHFYWININKGRISYGRDTQPGEKPLFEWTDPAPITDVLFIGLSCHKSTVQFQNIQTGKFIGPEKESVALKLSQAQTGDYLTQISALTNLAYSARQTEQDRALFVNVLSKLVEQRWNMNERERSELIRLLDRTGFLHEFRQDAQQSKRLQDLNTQARTQVTFAQIIGQHAKMRSEILALSLNDPRREEYMTQILQLVNKRKGKSTQDIATLQQTLLQPLKTDIKATKQEKALADMMIASFDVGTTQQLTTADSMGQYLLLTEDQFVPQDSLNVQVHFKAKATGGIVVALLPSAQQVKGTQTPLYEVILGADKNTKTVLRRMSDAHPVATVQQADSAQATVRADGQFHDYWISYQGGTIRVGSGQNVILKWKDPTPIPITTIGLGAQDAMVHFSGITVSTPTAMTPVVPAPQPPQVQPTPQPPVQPLVQPPTQPTTQPRQPAPQVARQRPEAPRTGPAAWPGMGYRRRAVQKEYERRAYQRKRAFTR